MSYYLFFQWGFFFKKELNEEKVTKDFFFLSTLVGGTFTFFLRMPSVRK